MLRRYARKFVIAGMLVSAMLLLTHCGSAGNGSATTSDGTTTASTAAITTPTAAKAFPQTQALAIPEVDDHYINSCPGGEDMLLNGVIHLVIHTTQDAGGGFHLAVRQSQAVSGIGLTTGAKYAVILTAGSIQNQPVGGPFEFTQTVNFRIEGQGPNGGTLGKDVAHFTVNANGEVAVFFENFTSVCS